jgi:hypothetical protein
MYDELAAAVRDRRVILFVGSGVSAGLGVPTWSGLINHMAEELGYDPEIFQSTSATYPVLAEYYRIQRGSIGPLRSWMDTNWDIPKDELRNSHVHKLIVELNFPYVYTTNYDRLLERSYALHGQPFIKIANVKDIAAAQEGTSQIIKYHGDFDDDASIVLTEQDYFKRLSFESPLDVKLRADSLGRPLLFIGYSLSDINVRLLLYNLSRTWKDAGFGQHQPASYLFQSQPDPIQEAVLGQWGIRVVTEDVDDPDTALSAFLQGLLSKCIVGGAGE